MALHGCRLRLVFFLKGALGHLSDDTAQQIQPPMTTRMETTNTQTDNFKERNEHQTRMTSLTGNLERAQQRAFNMCKYGDERLVQACPAGPTPQTLLLLISF